MALRLDPKWAWMETYPSPPRMMTVALGYVGLAEIHGPENNPIIMGMIHTLEQNGVLGVGFITDDETPWCGTAHAFFALMAGWTPVKDPAYALNWRTWGDPVPTPQMSFGDTVVRQRKNAVGKVIGGHVHQCVAVVNDGHHYIGLGANQGDKVSIEMFPLDNVVAVRRAHWKISQPAGVKQIIVDGAGVPTNVSQT